MRRLVVDASARIGTLSRPALSERLLGTFDAIAPMLFRWEVGNAIHARHAKAFGDLANRKSIVTLLLARVRLVDQAGREDAIGDVAARTGLTFYDAAYLQLALDEEALLVTEDRQLHAQAARVLGARRVWDLAAAEGLEPD